MYTALAGGSRGLNLAVNYADLHDDMAARMMCVLATCTVENYDYCSCTGSSVNRRVLARAVPHAAATVAWAGQWDSSSELTSSNWHVIPGWACPQMRAHPIPADVTAAGLRAAPIGHLSLDTFKLSRVISCRGATSYTSIQQLSIFHRPRSNPTPRGGPL
ncbi:uncharacterized protein CANTADRAFT_22018 [Suhomyces tanzawaensis NRRL Y-17324]|uniref:Uncharacterized protein n=1 Tax=Suhomyces tanzawaensis NRRL Y-17324 TaxID=984487 RepID=A0A1E4SID4_9ASCO|nr:uncharacterized protein CANTADRAFT_22018 [Suhomyces tanzawaensis NRRL Y-17324]ODV79263.1 hypothetical protein CANTADRAFT_22018 [Suhomyces tanzawaensis NRRL Y-17324]